MQNGKYKAVVFDLDGTAVDSRYNLEALQRTCVAMIGREATEEELKLSYGMTAQNSIRYFGIPDDQAERFEQLWIENIMELAKNAQLFEGIYPAMCRMKEAGILLGVNTSRTSREMGDLEHYIKEPFLQLCSTIVTCDKVAHPKPAPDSMLYFLQQHQLQPSEVLFVGDSEFDAGCAKAAGCDFALAVWGCFYPDTIDATYKPNHPDELLRIVGLA